MGLETAPSPGPADSAACGVGVWAWHHPQGSQGRARGSAHLLRPQSNGSTKASRVGTLRATEAEIAEGQPQDWDSQGHGPAGEGSQQRTGLQPLPARAPSRLCWHRADTLVVGSWDRHRAASLPQTPRSQAWLWPWPRDHPQCTPRPCGCSPMITTHELRAQVGAAL